MQVSSGHVDSCQSKVVQTLVFYKYPTAKKIPTYSTLSVKAIKYFIQQQLGLWQGSTRVICRNVIF